MNGCDTFLVDTFCTRILFLIHDKIEAGYVRWLDIFRILDMKCCTLDLPEVALLSERRHSLLPRFEV